ncbi:MAG: N-6 DNA methylase [Candidatus Cloacimonetes bacterium]|nr:N-6 DNA methylase [Candidatus Cloacimonadota bacterium]
MKEKTKNIISNLVIRFHRNKEIYKNPKYNETQLRREFLDPFFSALDWDVANKQGFAEQYKEVVHEDTIKISGTTKAPDYSFRIGGVRKFFVEAKKPAVDIKYDIHPSYQLRRYAWSAKLPISILTDFEEFSVYDCRIKPNQKDNASIARIYYQTYDKYLQNLDFIYNTFSKESILKGSFDKYISTATKKKGTSEVDKEFLKEIERWRDTLARNIALRNKKLSIFEINFVVQLTIDRIIFLRIAEDRGVEDYRNLYKLAEKKEIYKNLFHLFRIADDKYNSGIFDFQKDKISSNISIDDKVLKSILLHLYYPESPYEFSVLPADILGNIYEQFLGKTIRLTPSHQAKVEEKPEVRKAGGVYYTPQYIVDYIVKNTVGEKLKGKTPRQISKITICDPACGSGSFLIQAYQYLLDYHLEFYQKDIKKYKDKIIQISEDSYQLTTQEKKRILLNNVYGVDIDPQAVEVTKLSLLLKVLEGENRETLQSQLKLFHERALPNLSNNIKCGNSLIGTDFYDTADMSLFGNDAMRKINAFDWEKEFPKIFHQDKDLQGFQNLEGLSDVGFDVVIGNPPYVKYENLDNNTKIYAKSEYKCAKGFFDIFQLFLENSFKMLSITGLLGFIIPNLFLKGMNYKFSRKYFYENSSIAIVRNYGDGVFKKVKMPTCIIIFKKEIDKKSKVTFYLKRNSEFLEYKVPQQIFYNENYIYSMVNIGKELMRNNIKLEEIVKITRGLEIGRKLAISPNNNHFEILFGEDISRYLVKSKHYIENKIYNEYKKDEEIFKSEKLIIRETGNRITATYDDSGIITNRSLYCIRSNNINLKYLLAIINSKLIQYFYEEQFKSDSDIFPKIRIGQVKEIPVRLLDFSNPSEKQIHNTLVFLVDQMLSAQKQFHSAKIERDKKLYKQKIDILDRKIDRLVYEFYDLTKEEIGIVENDNENI